MRTGLLGRMRQRVGRIRGLLGPTSVILLYHRVIESKSNPYLLDVSPQHFEEHLQVIREVGVPMRLEELAQGVRARNLPDRAVCVTFDDGYQDNLYTAKPLLERYDVPATVFMTAGKIGRNREFWWDQLERVFLQPGRLPARLQLDVGGQNFDWDLSASADYSEDSLHRDRAWTLLDSNPPTARHSTFAAIYHVVQPMDEVDRVQVLDRLFDWSGISREVRATRRALDPDEIVALDKGDIVEVGGHTVHHPALSTQPTEVQHEEIFQCKSLLEKWLGHRVPSFSYPYGLYSDESVSKVREAGFDNACACMYRTVRRDSECFLLPRIDIYDVGGDVFAEELRGYLGR